MDDIRILLARINDFLGVAEAYDYPISALIVFIAVCLALIALGLIARGLAGIRDLYLNRTSAINHPDDGLLPHKVFAGQVGVGGSSDYQGSRPSATARPYGAYLYQARSHNYQVNPVILRQANQKIGHSGRAGLSDRSGFVGRRTRYALGDKFKKLAP